MSALILTWLLHLALLFGALEWLCRVCDLYWGKPGETKLRSMVENFWVRTADALPENILLKPLGVLHAFYDRLFGAGPFTRKSLWRSSVISILLLLISLSITGLVCDKPFGMAQTPWENYRFQLHLLDGMAKQPLGPGKTSEGGPIIDDFRINARDLASLNGTGFEIAYTVFYVLGLTLGVAAFNSISLAVCRLILKEMSISRSAMLVTLMLAIKLLLVLGLLVIASLFFFFGLNVGAWPFIPILGALSSTHFLAGAGVLGVSTWIAWTFTDPWFKTVVLLSLSPVAISGLVFAGCGLGFPFRKIIKAMTAKFLERGLESDKGLYSYFGMTALLIASAIAFAVKLLGGTN
jgi:hypothetical protein